MTGADASRGVLGPNVAGTWYPGEASRLEREIDRQLRDAAGGEALAEGRRVRAIVAPHAGLRYSGAVAASAFASLRMAGVERVVLFGPSHYHAFPGAAVPPHASYRTPLGGVAIDTEAIRTLAQRPGIRVADLPFHREHSLEMELPFLQRRLQPGWKLVPLLLGGADDAGENGRVAEALGELDDDSTLFVVSSDFVHYGRDFDYVPFENDVHRRIEELDMGAIERIRAGDADGFNAYVRKTGATICGRAAIEVLLRRLTSRCTATLSAYDTSGRMTDDVTHSVSYAGLVFHG
ncbi:MAG: AmmeMemoRadiSam system protein B [bacterium]|nr:AmmeMemoRadiSam system protein B [bacterium]